MFRLFNRPRSVSSWTTATTTTPVVRRPALVEGLEGRSMMSVSTFSPDGHGALLPAVQHGLLLPAVHPTGATSGTPGTPAPTGFIIAVL